MKKINWTLILSILGALAWLPFLFDTLTPTKIEGKLISYYSSVGNYRGSPATSFLMKVGILSRNSNFNIKDVDLRLRFKKSGWINTTSHNIREFRCTFENTTKKLNLKNEDFINNSILLPKDQAIVGYLITSIPELIDEDLQEVELLFRSFNGKTKKLSIDKSKMSEDKFLFDDNIWINAD